VTSSDALKGLGVRSKPFWRNTGGTVFDEKTGELPSEQDPIYPKGTTIAKR